MSMHKPILAIACMLALGAGTGLAETPGLGQPITEADIAAWNIDVLPDGTGLPRAAAPSNRARSFMRRSARFATGRKA